LRGVGVQSCALPFSFFFFFFLESDAYVREQRLSGYMVYTLV